MKITILCSSDQHPVFPFLCDWAARRRDHHEVRLVTRAAEAEAGGDILFLISCSELIRKPLRDRFRATLVIHASDLPKGRGWSPHVWEILGGADHLTVTLLEAEDRVDTGAIWNKIRVPLEGHELYDEINARLFAAECALMDYAVDQFDSVKPQPQPADGASYHAKRTPEMSALDPHQSLAAQFDQLRVADPHRFPAFFDYRGHRYILKIEKADR